METDASVWLQQHHCSIKHKDGDVCAASFSGVNAITNEICWARAKVFSTDGDFGPGGPLLGRDARDQWWLTWARHGDQRHARTAVQSEPGHTNRNEQKNTVRTRENYFFAHKSDQLNGKMTLRLKLRPRGSF